MVDDNLEQVTKEEFDQRFKEMISNVEDNLKEYLKLYRVLIDFRGEYRKDYKTHRLIHYFTDKGITYKKITKRNIGYRRNEDKQDE